MTEPTDLIRTGRVRIIADNPSPVPVVPKKDPWWRRLWKAMFG